MENKQSKFKWEKKNNGTIFSLCLVGVAAFSVLLATGQVKQARKEQENLVNEQAALDHELGRQEEITFMPQVDEALQNALEEPEGGLAKALEETDDGVILDGEEIAGTGNETIEVVDAAANSAEMGTEMFQTANEAGETADETVGEGLVDLDAKGELQQEAAPVSVGAAAQITEMLPTISFSETDTLTWPVAGNVVLDYSMDGSIYFPTLQQYKYNPALIIGSDEGAQVLAAAKGIVESIAVDNETGTTVMMSLGNGYKLKYGQLQGVTVAEGEVVNEGDLVGYVSQPTKYYCKEGANLYFSMTKDEKPVDPILYLE